MFTTEHHYKDNNLQKSIQSNYTPTTPPKYSYLNPQQYFHFLHHYQNNQDLDWLENILHSFQSYKDQKNHHLGLLTRDDPHQHHDHNIDKLINNVIIKDNMESSGTNQPNNQNNYQHKIKNQQDLNNLAKRVTTQHLADSNISNSNTTNPQKYRQYKRQNSLQSNLFLNNSDIIIQSTHPPSQPLQDPIHPRPIFTRTLTTNPSQKLTNIKLDRRYLLDTLSDPKKNTGKIIKNKSLDAKPKKRTYLTHHTEYHDTIKTNPLRKIYQQNLQQQDKIIQNNIQEYQPKFLNTQPIKSNHIIMISPPKYQQSHPTNYLLQRKSQKCNSSNNRLSLYHRTQKNINKQLELIQYQEPRQILFEKNINKQEKLADIKKQRKLNISYGKQVFHHQIPTNTKKIQYFQSLLKNKQNSQSKITLDQHPHPTPTPNNNSQHKQLPNLDHHYVKYVQSAKSSLIFSQHSLVVDKPQFNPDPKTNHQQQNILTIFNKLDGRKQGILTANNCSIQNVTREIRYIFGSVFQQILYKDLQFNFNTFVKRIQKCLQNIKTKNISSNHFYNEDNQISCKKQKQYSTISEENANQCQNYIQDKYPQKQSYKKYDYTKNLLLPKIPNQQSQHPTTSRQKTIRFATFQNDQEDPTSQQNTFIIPNINNSNLDQILDKSLSPLNNKPSLKFIHTTRSNNHTELPSSQSRKIFNNIDYNKNNYQHQISKLELLNTRLEKYLNHQNYQQLSNKLITQDI